MSDLRWCRKMKKRQQLNNVVTTVNSDMYTDTKVQSSLTEVSPTENNSSDHETTD